MKPGSGVGLTVEAVRFVFTPEDAVAHWRLMRRGPLAARWRLQWALIVVLEVLLLVPLLADIALWGILEWFALLTFPEAVVIALALAVPLATALAPLVTVQAMARHSAGHRTLTWDDHGVRSDSLGRTLLVNWSGVESVEADDRVASIVLGPAPAPYGIVLPARAFPSQQEFKDAVAELRRLWQEASAPVGSRTPLHPVP